MLFFWIPLPSLSYTRKSSILVFFIFAQNKEAILVEVKKPHFLYAAQGFIKKSSRQKLPKRDNVQRARLSELSQGKR